MTTTSTPSALTSASAREHRTTAGIKPVLREAGYWLSGIAIAVVLAIVAAPAQGTRVALTLGLTALLCTAGGHWIGLKRQRAVAEFRREQGEG